MKIPNEKNSENIDQEKGSFDKFLDAKMNITFYAYLIAFIIGALCLIFC
jgi:hypothetical protein